MSGTPGQRPPREATYLESNEEIREAIRARAAALAGRAVPIAPVAPAAAAALPPVLGQEPMAADDGDAQFERPGERPPMALLCVCDDGQTEGEWLRLRGDRFVLGRTEGDLRIVHDGQISGRHAEIVRLKTPAGYRWLLADLQSTNGTYVRVGRALLANGAEFLVGRGHFRFELPAVAANLAAQPPAGTLAWGGGVAVQALMPTLVQVTAGGAGQRWPLTSPEYWIGRDASACAIALAGDLLANSRHARILRDPKGDWHIENNKSLNGLWLRSDKMPLTNNCQFRCGEQRFLFRMP